MGIYINPRDMTKEQWLLENGTPQPQPSIHRAGDDVAVVYIDNGGFTAAGVAYNQRELEAFSDPADPRYKLWFSVPINKLIDVGAIQRLSDIEE